MKVLIPRISYLACFRDRRVVLSHDHVHKVRVTSLFGLRRRFGGGGGGLTFPLILNLGTGLEVSMCTEFNQFFPLRWDAESHAAWQEVPCFFCVGPGKNIPLFIGTYRRTLFWFICIQGKFPHHVSFKIRCNEVLLSTPRRLNYWNTPTFSNTFTGRAYSNSRFGRPASLRLTSPD
jgi:hypothetical protein